MSKIDIDLSKVQERPLLPKGKYPGMVEELYLHEKEGSEYPSLKWRFVLTEGDLEGTPFKPMFTSLSPKALFRVKAVLQALGVKIPEGGKIEIETDDDTGLVTTPMVIGTPCLLDVGIELYEGAKQNYIVNILPMFDEAGQGKLPMNEASGRNIS